MALYGTVPPFYRILEFPLRWIPFSKTVVICIATSDDREGMIFHHDDHGFKYVEIFYNYDVLL